VRARDARQEVSPAGHRCRRGFRLSGDCALAPALRVEESCAARGFGVPRTGRGAARRTTGQVRAAAVIVRARGPGPQLESPRRTSRPVRTPHGSAEHACPHAPLHGRGPGAPGSPAGASVDPAVPTGTSASGCGSSDAHGRGSAQPRSRIKVVVRQGGPPRRLFRCGAECLRAEKVRLDTRESQETGRQWQLLATISRVETPG
jgi:hypothetical protein